MRNTMKTTKRFLGVRRCSQALTALLGLGSAVSALPGCGLVPSLPPPVPTGPFTQIVVFGDSLSDSGNLLATFSIVPQAPYVDGRLSNGPVWVERIATRFGVTARPSFRGGTNFAYGAANSGLGQGQSYGLPLGPNVRQQITLYHGQPLGTELFVVWGGAKDLFDVLNGECTDTPEAIAENIALAVAALYDRGGRWFLVPNLPDLGLVPRYRNGARQQRATELSLGVNAALAARLDDLETRPDIRIWRPDIAAMFEEMIASPPEGVTNVTDPAWTGGYFGFSEGDVLAANPDEYIFWDDVHPTRIGHQILADRAIAMIEANLPTAAPPANSPGFTLNLLPPETEFWLMYFAAFATPDESEVCRY